MEQEEIRLRISEAKKRLASFDAIDRNNNQRTPKDVSHLAVLAVVFEALLAGVSADDWDCVFDAIAMCVQVLEAKQWK